MAAGKYFSRVLFIAAGNDISVPRFKRNARELEIFFDKTLDRNAHDTLYKTVRAIIESRM